MAYRKHIHAREPAGPTLLISAALFSVTSSTVHEGEARLLASFGLVCTMAMAVHFHAVIKDDPFLGFEGSCEPALIYFCIALLFLLLGPGRYSMDALIFDKKSGSSNRTGPRHSGGTTA